MRSNLLNELVYLLSSNSNIELNTHYVKYFMTNVDINKINITTYSTNRDIHFKENTSPRQHKNESVDPPHSLPKYYKTLRKAKKGGTLGSLKYFDSCWEVPHI